MPRTNKKPISGVHELTQQLAKKNARLSQLVAMTKKKVDNTEEDTTDITFDSDIVIDAAKDKEEFKKEIQEKLTDELTKSEERLIEKLRLKILEELKLEADTKKTFRQKETEIRKAEKQKALEEKRAEKQKALEQQRLEDKKYYEELIKQQVYQTSKKADLYKKIEDIKYGRRAQFNF
jgi:hypothetical protein